MHNFGNCRLNIRIAVAGEEHRATAKVIGASCLNVSQAAFSSLVEGRDIRYRIHAPNLNNNPIPNAWMQALPWMFNYINHNVNSSGSNYFQSPRKSLPVIIGPTTGEIIDDEKTNR